MPNKNHRGRFQAQGNKLEEAESWSQDNALLYIHGKILLENLRKKLTPADLKLRAAGIIECSAAIKRIHKNGGYHVVDKPFGESYPTLKKGSNNRIDLEIKKGSAFV